MPAFEPKLHEDGLPGHETELEPTPSWQPRYPGSGRLAGRVALVTGADSGIGRAVAVLFAREGARLGLLFLEETEDARITRAAVEAEGGEALLLQGDVGDRAWCAEVIARMIGRFGRLDILINNAGEQHADQDITEITEQQLQRTFQTNVFGMFHLTAAARPYLKTGAVIINTTSVTSFRGSKELIDYSSTKGAITAFTRALAANLVKEGIRVNAVAPGPIWTPLNPMGGASPDKMRNFGKDTPMGRPGQPNEVAPAYLFLACADGSYFTGQVLHPNGGIPVGG